MHTIDQIQAFVAVFDTGSYSNAAKKLNKSRATVREHIHAYEDALGYELFYIEGKKAAPTDNAKRLIKRARLVERQHSSLYEHGLNLFESETSEITICINTFTPLDLISKTNTYIRTHWPQMNVNWIHRTREQSLQGLVDNVYDLAILPNQGKVFAEKNVTWRALGSVDFGIYTRIESPLALEQSPTLEDLFLDTHILTEAQVDLGASISGFRASPNSIVVSNNELMLQLLRTEGWAFLPKRYVSNQTCKKSITEIEMNEVGRELAFMLNVFHLYGKDQEEPFSSIIDFIQDSFT